MDAFNTFQNAPQEYPRVSSRVLKSFYSSFFLLLFINNAFSDLVDFKTQEDSSRPIPSPTQSLSNHVRQITDRSEIEFIAKNAIQELNAQSGRKLTHLDLNFIFELASRGQLVALETKESNGSSKTYYGFRQSLNRTSRYVNEFAELYKKIVAPKEDGIKVLINGIGTSIQSLVMEQFGDVDINFMLLDVDFNGDPEALKRMIPDDSAKKFAKYLQKAIAEIPKTFPGAVFTELKAGSPNPEPFSPHVPPKGEKWTFDEIKQGWKTFEVMGPNEQISYRQVELWQAIQDDTYVKFDFYMDGIADRKDEFLEYTACFRFGGVTPNGKVFLRQSEKQLHFPPARSTTFFPDATSFLLSVMANENEAPMPSVARANQLMIGKIHEVLTVTKDNPFARYEKATKVVAARTDFWKDADHYGIIFGDSSFNNDFLHHSAIEISNNSELKTLANLLSETKYFIEIFDRDLPLFNKSSSKSMSPKYFFLLPGVEKANERIQKYARRLNKKFPELASAIQRIEIKKDQYDVKELSNLFHQAKMLVQKATSEKAESLLSKQPSIKTYIHWLKDRFKYLSDSKILDRASLIAYPAPNRVKSWYEEFSKKVSLKYPKLLRHNPEDLHGTVLFAGFTTAETQSAIVEKFQELLQSRRMDLTPKQIGILGSEGTYVGITFDIDTENRAVLRQLQFDALTYGTQPTRFFGNVNPHITLFWIPKNATLQERQEFERFKAEYIPILEAELKKIFPTGKWTWSGTPMITQTTRLENPAEKPGELPRKVYEVLVPANPRAEDIKSGEVDVPRDVEVVTYSKPQDVFAAWDAPDIVAHWIDENRSKLESMFTHLSFTEAKHAHIPLDYARALDPSLALTVDRQVFEPMAQSEVSESYIIAQKGDSKKVRESKVLKGVRLIVPKGFQERTSLSSGHSIGAVALEFSVGNGFSKEIIDARRKFNEKIYGSLNDPEHAIGDALHVTIARERDNADKLKSKIQLKALVSLLALPKLLQDELHKINVCIKTSHCDLSDELRLALRTIIVGVYEADVRIPDELEDLIRSAKFAVNKYQKKRTEASQKNLSKLLERVKLALLNLNAELIVRGIEEHPYHISSRPHFYGTLSEGYHIRMPLSASHGRSGGTSELKVTSKGSLTDEEIQIMCTALLKEPNAVKEH